jgi:chemotaxis protein histidine kinase CheA
MKIIKTSLIIAGTTVFILGSNAFCMSPAAVPSAEFSSLATQRMLPSLSPQIYRTFGTEPSTFAPETPPVEPSSFDNQIRRGRAGATSRSFVTSSSLRPSSSSRLTSPFFNQPFSRGFASSFEAGFSYDPKKLGTALDNLSKLLNKHFKTDTIKLTKNSTWRDILHMSQKDITPTTAENKKKILQNIKFRYFELSKIVHTDQNKTPEAATQFVILQEAHENGTKSVEKNTLTPMSFNPPASQYTSQTSSSSSQSQQRSSASQAKNDWQTQQEQRERAAYEKAAREAAEEARRREQQARQQQSSSQSRQQQQSSSWSSSNTDSRTNNSQEQRFRQSRAQAEQQWKRLLTGLVVLFGTGRLIFGTGRFALKHKGKIAAAIIIYKMYKKHRESSARELYKQQRALMDQLEVDDYWHTHELTDKALVEIARKNFAKQFIDTYLDGKYNKESVENFYTKEGIKLNALDEQWMKNKLSKIDARYSRILDQLDTLQKARDEMFNRKTTIPIKDRLNENIYKEIAEGLKDYVSQNKLGWF